MGGSTSEAGNGTGHLKTLAMAFIGKAFSVLKDQRVLPVASFQPFLRVGHDYAGPDLMYLPEFEALDKALTQAYPERFSDPLTRPDPSFANEYIFSVLEAAIARCAQAGADFDASSTPVTLSVDELIAVLDSADQIIHCCRAVSHISTADNGPVTVGAVSIHPAVSHSGLIDQTARLIPRTSRAFHGDVPFIYAPPHALLVASTTTQTNGEDERRRLSAEVDRFMLLARLLHAGTHQSGWEVTGASTMVSGVHRRARALASRGLDDRLQRVIHLSPADAPAFEKLSSYIDAAVVKRDGMVITSFDMALYSYNRAHQDRDDFDQLVDLSTALEAVLTSGEKDTEAVSLRLRSRAAALLASETDPATAIFRDIGELYGLRSTLVHGGALKETDLRKAIDKLSTVPSNIMFGVAIAFAVDRLRDLVRRSILARLCLASGPEPLWPFNSSTGVDAALADDTTRSQWRSRWRKQLADLGAAGSADAAKPGIDPMSRRSLPVTDEAVTSGDDGAS